MCNMSEVNRAFISETSKLVSTVVEQGNMLIDSLRTTRNNLVAGIKDVSRVNAISNTLIDNINTLTAEKRVLENKLTSLEDANSPLNAVHLPNIDQSTRRGIEEGRQQLSVINARLQKARADLDDNADRYSSIHNKQFSKAADEVIAASKTYVDGINSLFEASRGAIDRVSNEVRSDLVDNERSRMTNVAAREVERVRKELDRVFKSAIDLDNVNINALGQESKNFAAKSLESINEIGKDTVDDVYARIKAAFEFNIDRFFDIKMAMVGLMYSKNVVPMYLLKALRLPMLYAAQFLSVKIFINHYENRGPDNRPDLRWFPALFIMVCFAIDILIAGAVRMVVATSSQSGIDGSLMSDFVMDTAICYVMMIASSVPICGVIQSSDYFAYGDSGARAIRLAGHLVVAIGVVNVAVPHFYSFSNLIMRLNPVIETIKPHVHRMGIFTA